MQSQQTFDALEIPSDAFMDVGSVDKGNGERHLVTVVQWHEVKVDDIVPSEAKRSYPDNFSFSSSDIHKCLASGIIVDARGECGEYHTGRPLYLLVFCCTRLARSRSYGTYSSR